MTPITLDAEPACPAGDGLDRGPDPSAGPRFRAERRPVEAFSREAWDALAGANPWATPFSGWAFQRAWWDGYGVNAYDETLAIVPADAPGDGSATPVAIVPLMHRHEVESSDAATRTRLRRDTDADLTQVAPDATAIFFGASYHADYATILAAPADLPDVADAVAAHLADARRPGLGRRGPAAAPLRRPDGRRPRRGLRGQGDRRGLDAQRRARGCLPGGDAAGGRRPRRLPRHARQEGAPRDPAQGPAGRGRGRDPPRRLDRSARPTSMRSSTSTSGAGARPACSRRPRAGSRAASSSAACSSCPAPTARSA